MEYLIGYIAGIVTAGLIFTILAYFRAGIEKRIKIIETRLGNAGPQVRGAIFIPDSDDDAARKEIIEKNKKQGKDTPISELTD